MVVWYRCRFITVVKILMLSWNKWDVEKKRRKLQKKENCVITTYRERIDSRERLYEHLFHNN